MILKDLRSSFGCYVNGIRVIEEKIKPGDDIQMGNTIIKLADETTLEKIRPIRMVQATRIGIEELKNQVGEITEMATDPEIKKRLGIISRSLDKFEEAFTEVEQDRELARTLIEVGRATNLIIDLRVLLNLIIDFTLKNLIGEKGIVIVEDEVKASRGIDLNRADQEPIFAIAYEVLKERRSVFSGRSLAAPIMKKDGSTIGVLGVELDRETEPRDLTILEGFASQAGLAIESVMLHDRIRKEERIRDRLYRFFSPTVVDAILKGEHKLGGVQVEATILFADIRGFTPMVENLEPGYTVELLNEFLSVMTEEVFNEDGTLDKYVGDCIMAIFGAPIQHPDDPLRAVRASLGMKQRVREVNEKWQRRGFKESLRIGIGINTGKVLAGNIGSEKRMDYTVISDAVNLASRLEGVAGPGQIIVSENTYLKVKDSVETKRLDPVRVQGKKEPVPIYEVIGLI
ncbi:MAG TPA: hypothetical protein EYP24_05340 [bacterium (Candidatus Stahlbacteria)]|nr:hypothetical protein [Candidatus Stahlbacteria bacterium]